MKIPAAGRKLRHRLAKPAKRVRQPSRTHSDDHQLHHAAPSQLCRPYLYHVGGGLSRTEAHPGGSAGPQGFLRPHRPGAGPGRIQHRPEHEWHQRRTYPDHRLCPQGAGRQRPGGDRRHQKRRGEAHLSGRRLRRRAPRAQLLHGLRQVHAYGLADPDAGLRQVPLQ